ncbi:MAG: TIGR00730 family Rossman fold protein [Candidatus Saccharimonadaceae bacterium]
MADIKIPSINSLKAENNKNHLLVRQKLIDAAEGRLVTVVEEFERAFDILGKYENTVTVFGSARLDQDNPVCRAAFDVSLELSKRGYAIVTGGGGGVMEAANHGAIEAGGASIGFNIHLPMEQSLNKYTTESYRFEHFFGRKVAMTLDASAYIYASGGFGTFDELFEVMTLIQTGIVPQVPVILLGKDFWMPFDSFIRDTLADRYHTIEPEDRSLYIITDDIKQIVEVIESSTLERAREEMFTRADRLKYRWIVEGKR